MTASTVRIAPGPRGTSEVSFDYDTELWNLVLEIVPASSRRWLKSKKVWRIKDTCMSPLVDAFRQVGRLLSDHRPIMRVVFANFLSAIGAECADAAVEALESVLPPDLMTELRAVHDGTAVKHS